MPKVHPAGKPRGLAHSLSQGTFQLQAYKSGLLRPGTRDISTDRTITEFSDPSPSKAQRQLASLSYHTLGKDWQRRVQTENAQQDLACWRQYEKASRRRGLEALTEARSFAHLTRLDARMHLNNSASNESLF